MHKKIKELSGKRIKYLIDNQIPFYEGNKTYLNAIKDELYEVEEEIKENNSVYLEDELGDVFWAYICFLHSLENEGKITSVDRVFERCYKKFGERVGFDGKGGQYWDEVKVVQKEKLRLEHNKLFNNDR
ncbi:MAG: MazG nucleotide pyrophosphohydrolase domain-containing protein [Candidatus Gracilibacteria bacterium]|nr:MazG nucleotide pyrophosphohydrolase domain-containing protein [Candidatus Gracilibacteria bacterium]